MMNFPLYFELTFLIYLVLHATLSAEHKQWKEELAEGGIWSYGNIQIELENSFSWFKPQTLKWVLTTGLEFFFKFSPVFYIASWGSLSLFTQGKVFGPAALLICLLILTLSHMLLNIRFRGLYNGGSDMMMMTLSVGIIIDITASIFSTHVRWGLVYIGLNLLLSYLKAGLVKIKNIEWIKGKALFHFLSTTEHQKMKLAINRISQFKLGFSLFWIVSFLTLVFELSVPLVFLNRTVLIFYFCFAVVFHFGIFIIFGLNRFFWAWLAAWPSLFYLYHLVRA